METEEQAASSSSTADLKNSKIRQEMSNVPLCELLELKEKLGTKKCNKILYGSQMDGGRLKAKFKRDNPKRPAEISSKIKVPVFREVFVEKKSEKRDPRFDDSCGSFKPQHFKQNYDFISEMKAEEKSVLKQKLKDESDENKRLQIKMLIRRIEDQEKTESLQDKIQSKQKEIKKQNLERLKQGKQPFYVKKSEFKRSLNDDHLKELEKKGKLDKYLKRKAKKEARIKSKPFTE